MLSRVHSLGLRGVDGFPVLVELDLAGGLPAFTTVGLPDHAVKESRDRVAAAVRNSGFKFPSRRVTVNLAPARPRKEGSHYDLPIALALLAASGQAPAGEWEKNGALSASFRSTAACARFRVCLPWRRGRASRVSPRSWCRPRTPRRPRPRACALSR